VSKARVAKMVLPHHVVDTPVFMPVGTQGSLKGVTPRQLADMDCQIMLANTYHLGNKPVGCGEVRSITLNDAHHCAQGPELLRKVGGLHQFMDWNRALLTVSTNLLYSQCSSNVYSLDREPDPLEKKVW